MKKINIQDFTYDSLKTDEYMKVLAFILIEKSNVTNHHGKTLFSY